jgi:hypothetical protein
MASWQTPLCPFTIDFAPDKLDEIRMAVVDGFYAVPHGGVEIGGVLFGKREDGRLRIDDFRKIETEYLSGPSFRLSENDLAGLRNLLAQTRFKDPEIRPVGWFLSHTRSGIHLPEKDLALFRQLFPEPSQITLVLRPDKLGTVRAGYFFRQSDGLIKTDAPLDEFTLAPYTGEKQAPPEELVSAEEPAAAKESPQRVPEQILVSPPEPAVAVTPEPAIADPRPMFQAIYAKPSWSMKKRVFVALLSLGSLAAAIAGYFAAAH